MAVSKIAVIALVAVIAVPILLGYALNLTETTETDYRTTGEAVNVTPLLKSGTGYSYAAADNYQLNSNFYYGGSDTPISPIYNNISSIKSGMIYQQFGIPGWTGGYASIGDSIVQYDISIDYDNTSGYVDAVFYDNGTPSFTVNRIQSFHYDQSTEKLYYTYYAGASTVLSRGNHQFTDLTGINYTFSGGLASAPLVYGYTDTSNISYIDISSGYYFQGVQDSWSIGLTKYTKDAILTIDLDSITDDNYSIKIGAGGHAAGTNFSGTHPYILTKTTTAGVVTWTLTYDLDHSRTWELYYDPTIPHNTYQFYCDYIYDHTGDPYESGGYEWNNHYYNSHREFRYVGNWPDTIGEANVYWKVTDDDEMYVPMLVHLPDYVDPHYSDYNYTRFYIGEITSDSQNRTPTFRADAATFRAFEYPTIENKTYDPSTFRTNPSTTIKDIVAYGSSFIFGGNTYNVTKGNITLGSHDIPVDGLVLSSVPNVNGGYDNKIGNTIVSTTLYPSTITFNGKWSASISTIEQESYTYTKTEWNAGSFAWDGIDQNFLIVGLVTCLGVFVALGIYAKKRGSGGLIPLMIAVGCAAAVFFIML